MRRLRRGEDAGAGRSEFSEEPDWPPVDQPGNNLTIEDNLGRGGELTRRAAGGDDGQSHVELLCHIVLLPAHSVYSCRVWGAKCSESVILKIF